MDKTIRTASAQHVLDGVSSAHKELLWLEGTGHIVPVDAERELVWQRVASFIGQTTSPFASGSLQP
jgi:carboxylesterase